MLPRQRSDFIGEILLRAHLERGRRLLSERPGTRPRLLALGLTHQSVQRYLQASDGEQTLHRVGENRLRDPPPARTVIAASIADPWGAGAIV